jgi:molybdenum cofactor synthesis domain-containing protein
VTFKVEAGASHPSSLIITLELLFIFISTMTAIKAIAITVSDRCARGEQEDLSGAALLELLREAGAEIVAQEVVSDDLEPLVKRLRELADRPDINLIITTGGTGLSPRDNTPEATLRVIEKAAPGLAEAMRMGSLKQTPTAMLSRGICGIRSGTLIVNLPGSTKAVRESFAVIRPVLNHAVALLSGRSSHGPDNKS